MIIQIFKRALAAVEAGESFALATVITAEGSSPGKPGQITAHLRHARHPLVADPDRGGAGIFLSQLKRDYEPKKGQEERPLIGRPALHLETVELQHPVRGPITIAPKSVHVTSAKVSAVPSAASTSLWVSFLTR